MIIERFRPGKVKEMYQRFAEKGRMIPDGVQFVSSWINETVTICYQVMEAESREQLQVWINNWEEFVDFEVVPVISSSDAKQRVFNS